MDETDQIMSSPQNWHAEGLIISVPTRQKRLYFDRWEAIDVDYRIAKVFFIFYNLVKLFTVQNRLELGLQLPRRYALFFTIYFALKLWNTSVKLIGLPLCYHRPDVTVMSAYLKGFSISTN